ncbi:hypothetical protein J7E83_14650 [Arthrobacter sp. ISL-48]|nr:hypothetical protein [Arthrobacter sp. ISL-48]
MDVVNVEQPRVAEDAGARAVIAAASRGLGEAMVGITVDEIPHPHRLAERGW